MQTFRSSARRYALVAGAHRGAYRSIEMLRWVACASSLLRQRDSHSADFPPGRQGSYFCLREKKNLWSWPGNRRTLLLRPSSRKGQVDALKSTHGEFPFPVRGLYIYLRVGKLGCYSTRWIIGIHTKAGRKYTLTTTGKSLLSWQPSTGAGRPTKTDRLNGVAMKK